MNFNNHHSHQGITMSPSAGLALSTRLSGALSWGPDNPGEQTIPWVKARLSPQIQKMVKKNTPPSSSSNKTPETLVSGSKMASAISVSAKTLQRFRKDGMIGFYRIGRTIRYDVAEVMEALAEYHVMSRAQQARPKATSTR